MQPTPGLLVHNPTLHACKGLAVQALCTVSPVHPRCCTVPASCLQRQPTSRSKQHGHPHTLHAHALLFCTEGFKLLVPGKERTSWPRLMLRQSLISPAFLATYRPS